MSFLTIFAVAALLLALAAPFLYLRKRRRYAKCSECGLPSQFGYLNHAESEANQIVQLCLACLSKRLREDYEGYLGRALVIEPAADLPCYVFQGKSKWLDSGLVADLAALVSSTEDICGHCGAEAHFLWITANGLLPTNFSELLSNGLSQTLLRWGNDKPCPMCAKCCVALILSTIEKRSLKFLEVCAPRFEDGFVMPMAY